MKSGATPEPLTIGFVFEKDGRIEIVGHEAADKLKATKAKALRALTQQKFPNRTALAGEVGGNRQKAFDGIKELIAEGQIEESANGELVLSATRAVLSTALEESGTPRTTAAESVPAPTENRLELGKTTALRDGTGVTVDSRISGSVDGEPNYSTIACQIDRSAVSEINYERTNQNVTQNGS